MVDKQSEYRTNSTHVCFSRKCVCEVIHKKSESSQVKVLQKLNLTLPWPNLYSV